MTIEAGVGLPDDRFLPGDPVPYGISVITSGNATISPFPPAMWITSLDTDSVVYSEPAGDRTWELTSGITGGYRSKCFWDQKDDDGNQVESGSYEIGYEWVVIEEDTGKRYEVTRTETVYILDPDSAMNASMDVFQTVTSSDIPVTLERLEMDAKKALVTIFVVPEGYTRPDIDDLEDDGAFVQQSVSEVSIDGGVSQQPFQRRAQFGNDGIRITWETDPVPVFAQKLTFTITRLGDTTGYWEFQVPLQ